MDPRIRSSVYEGAHGSPLYTAPRKNINPSTSGDRIQEEIAEVTRWANQHLASGGHTDQLITDLSIDMADGITLLQLVQVLCKEELPKHYPNPVMRVQKLENLQTCLQMLQERGLSMKGIHADDIVGGNVKTILAVCHTLRRSFTASDSKSPKTSTSEESGVSSLVDTSSPSTAVSSSSSPTKSRGLSFSSLDREDIALLGWLGETVHRDISTYSMLYDGKILCDFANEVKNGSVSEQDIISCSVVQRLQIAFSALEKSLFVKPKDLDVTGISTGKEDAILRHFLASCRSVYKSGLEVRRKTGSVVAKKATEQQQQRRSVTSPSKMTREQVFESLRGSSGSTNSATSTAMVSLEKRERAKVEARSLEGILYQRRNGGHTGRGGEDRKSDESQREFSQSSNRLSGSIDGLSSAVWRNTNPTSSASSSKVSSGSRGTLHRSHDRLPPFKPPTTHQSQPLSDIYVRSDTSFPTRVTRKFKEFPNLPLSPEDWELDGVSGRAINDALCLSQPGTFTSISPSSSSLSPTRPISSSLGRSHSTEHVLGPDTSMVKPMRQISATSSSSSHSSTLAGSKSHKSSTDGSSYTLPRGKKQSSSTPPLPSPLSPTPPPPPPSVPPPSGIRAVNQPTFVPPGGGRWPQKSPTYQVSSDSNSLAAQIADVQDRIVLLSNQLLYEKADVYTRLHRAVIRERRRRQATERRLKEFESVAQQLVHHYDNLFVQLGKELGRLREEVAWGSGGTDRANRYGTSSRLHLAKEADQLKEQQPQAGAPHLHSEPLFMRKRASSESNLSGPYVTGSVSSYKKLSRFFGEDPPRLENIETFLEGLGYSHLYPIFSVHQISLPELYQMEESHLEVLGIPLGPTVRIMAELAKLEPLPLQETQQRKDMTPL